MPQLGPGYSNPNRSRGVLAECVEVLLYAPYARPEFYTVEVFALLRWWAVAMVRVGNAERSGRGKGRSEEFSDLKWSEREVGSTRETHQ